VAERKTKVTIPNLGTVDASEVTLEESVERWSELKLSDGSVLRIKPAVLSVLRVDGQYDQSGNPLYVLQAGNTMTVASAPDNLRQPNTDPLKVQ
jgi:hypothetical protein